MCGLMRWSVKCVCDAATWWTTRNTSVTTLCDEQEPKSVLFILNDSNMPIIITIN